MVYTINNLLGLNGEAYKESRQQYNYNHTNKLSKYFSTAQPLLILTPRSTGVAKYGTSGSTSDFT